MLPGVYAFTAHLLVIPEARVDFPVKIGNSEGSNAIRASLENYLIEKAFPILRSFQPGILQLVFVLQNHGRNPSCNLSFQFHSNSFDQSNWRQVEHLLGESLSSFCDLVIRQ